MPFITQHVRDILALGAEPKEPGDFCYRHYKWMVNEWKKEPRWMTASMIYAHVRTPNEDLREQLSKELAWQVFFMKFVMPYEDQKEKENGTI